MADQLERTRTPGVYRKGNRYVVIYRHRGRQHKRTFRTYDEARRGKATITADVARGEHREADRQTFGEYARDWIDTYTGRTTRGFRESTRVGYRRSIEQQAIPFFDKRARRLAELEPRDVRAFIAHLFDQDPAPAVSTVRNHVAAVRALFATAVEDGVLRHNPAAGVRISRPGTTPTKDAREQRRALTRTELRAFLAACPDEWRLFFELLGQTGVRISEALELRWGDVDFTGRRLRVRRQIYRGTVGEPKSRFGKRDIPLSQGLCQRLRLLERFPDELVFPNALGEHLHADVIRRAALKPAREAAGVPWAGFHTFRHTTASLLFDAGRNVKQVQEWLGHSDPGFTLRTYVHLLDDGLGDAEFFDDAFAGAVSDRLALSRSSG